MQFLSNITPFLDYRYLLNLNPIFLGPSLVGAIFTFISWLALIAIGGYAYFVFIKKANALKAGIGRKVARLFGTTAAFGYLLLFFAYEQVPFFAMRLWPVVLLIAFVAQLINLAVYLVRDYPKLKHERDEQSKYKKYFPGHSV